jgi:ribosomal protein S2
MSLTKATVEHNYRVLNILDKAKKDEEDRLTQGKLGIVEKEKKRLQKLVYR